jgi:hypothetical protein
VQPTDCRLHFKGVIPGNETSIFFVSALAVASKCIAQHAEDSIITSILKVNQYAFIRWKEFFIREAGKASFFMLGELNGEQEILSYLHQ